MNPDFTTNFFRQLRFWAFHGTLNALPSLIIAIDFLQLHEHGPAIVAMLAAIAVFAVVLSAATALVADLNVEGHPLARGLQAAVTFRAWMCGISAALVVAVPPAAFFVPDFWCGYFAAGLTEETAALLGLPAVHVETGQLWPVLLTTLVEGALLATGLAMLAFFLGLHFQTRDRLVARAPRVSAADSPVRLRR